MLPLLLGLIAAPLLLPREARAAEKDPAAPVAEQIIRLTYNCDFDEAMRTVVENESTNPDSIKWEFFRSAVLWQKMIYLDSAMYDARSVETDLTNSLSAVIASGERRLANNPEDTTALFYTGFALGYRAKLDAARGNEFEAAADGNKGLEYHRKLLAFSPNCYDAYFSLALFNYYTAFLPWYLRPLLFILGKSGSKEKADGYLNLVRRKGEIVRYEAEDMLGEFYGRVNKPDSVRLMYHDLISEFPGAAFHYYDKLTWVLMDGKHYKEEALECENAVRASEFAHMTAVDTMYLGKLYDRLANCYEWLGEYADAIQTYRNMIARNITPALAASAHFSLGRLYERADDSRDAAREYRWVVNAVDEPDLVRKARQRLDELGMQ